MNFLQTFPSTELLLPSLKIMLEGMTGILLFMGFFYLVILGLNASDRFTPPPAS